MTFTEQGKFAPGNPNHTVAASSLKIVGASTEIFTLCGSGRSIQPDREHAHHLARFN
jgi:hypothetical protein